MGTLVVFTKGRLTTSLRGTKQAKTTPYLLKDWTAECNCRSLSQSWHKTGAKGTALQSVRAAIECVATGCERSGEGADRSTQATR